ncbi:MAG: M3 family peptidase [Alphaproteobacteria bacterium]|nr:MAG: M3 family peptidase [Alphaproteobacteria bacterium]
MSNPLLETWTTPFGLPPFDRIEPEHFKPAFDTAFAEHNGEIDAIIENQDAPSFANTLEPYERAGALLRKVSAVFYNLASGNTNEALQAIQSDLAPRMAAHWSTIQMNEKLFARINAVYENNDQSALTDEQSALLTEIHKDFVRAGAALSPEARAEVEKLDEELAGLTTHFGQNMLKSINSFELFLDEADLAGVPQGIRDAAAEAARDRGQVGKYFFTITRSSMNPILQFADSRQVREKIYKAYLNLAAEGSFDNRPLAARISALRARRAQLLGFSSHAAYMLDDRMAKTPERALELLKDLWVPTQRKVEEEARDLQKKIQDEGQNFELAPWDWKYYAEKIRAERFDLNNDEVRPYFALPNVRDGAFYVAGRLYGLTFTRLDNVALPHADAEAYEVTNESGDHIGIFVADYYMRSSKRDGAWMSSLREQSNTHGRVRPIVTNTCNFPKPKPGEVALLSFDEVRTVFHEFGHALHGLLTEVTYEHLAGTSVKRDFVELPSQIMEHWAMEPEVLHHYARHVETGEVIPDRLITKIQAASSFGQGFITGEYLAASFLDFAWSQLETDVEQDTESFEAGAMAAIGLTDKIAPRYRSTYFSHIFSGGYSAGYYSYIWAEVLDCDGYEAFKENGIFDPATANAFKENILMKGGTADPMALYKAFRGREPEVTPLLKDRGLL